MFLFFTAAHTFNSEAPNEEKFVPDRWKKDNESVFVCDLKLCHQQFVRFAAQNLFSSQSSDPSCVLDSETWTFISSLLSVTCWLVEKSGNLFFFIKDQLSFRKPQLLAAGTTCSSGRPLLCSLHFHYREQTFLHVDSNKRTGDCFFVIYLTFVYFVIFLMMSFKQKQTGTQTCE